MAYPLWHPPSKPPTETVSRVDFEHGFSTGGEFGESSYVEFKTGTGRAPVSEVIVAFSNGDGGNVLFGVNDRGQVVGRSNAAGLSVVEALHEAARTTVNPGRYSIYDLTVGTQHVIVLAVEKRREGFAQTSDGRVLVRRGANNVAAYGADLAHIVSRTLRRPYESTETDVLLSDADELLIDRIASAYGWSAASAQERLRNKGLCHGDPAKLTITGVLLLLPDPERILPKAFVEIYRYPSATGEYDRRERVVGPVVDQIERAAQFILDELGTELVVIGLRRHEIPRLPAVVVREALANAVAHRSYEMASTSIRVELRPEAVVVRSPGGLVEPVTVNNIREQQASRNPDLIDVLRRFGLAEDAGRGVDVMEDEMGTEMLQAPFFQDDGRSVQLTLPIQSPVTPRERAWVRELQVRGEIEPTDRLLLVHAARGEELTNSKAREILRIDSLEARSALRRLRTLGYLEQSGQRGGARYRLGASLGPPAGLRLSRTELQALVVDMARRRPISNADVRAVAGLEAASALDVLNELVEQGRLVRTGERRGTRYALPEAEHGE
jgi:ATP-dependent DNA helicase RecG